MASQSNTAYVAILGLLGFVACIGATVVYVLRKGAQEVHVEAQRPRQVSSSGVY